MDDTGKKKGFGEDIWEQALHEVAPTVARVLVRALPEAFFRKPDVMTRLIQIGLPLLSLAIARITPDGGVWEYIDELRVEFTAELREAVNERLGGNTSSKEPAPRTNGKKGDVMDPTVIVWSKDDGRGGKIRDYHHPSCVELPQRTVERAGGGAHGAGKRMVPNPALREMKESEANSQGIIAHTNCHIIFETLKSANAPRGKPQTFLEMLGSLEDHERLEFWNRYEKLTDAKKTEVIYELETALRSVDELRVIITAPETHWLVAVEGLKNPIADRLVKAAKEIGAGLTAVRDDIRSAGGLLTSKIGQMNAGLGTLANELNQPDPPIAKRDRAIQIARAWGPFVLIALVFAAIAAYGMGQIQ